MDTCLGIDHHQNTWLTLSGFPTFPTLQIKTMGYTRSQGLITKESNCHQSLKSQIFVAAFISSLNLVLLYHENGPLQLS
jgi:hypothetical protein